MRTSIIIPVFNQWALTRDCLESLACFTERGSFEVILVDNASSDETSSACQAWGQKLFGSDFLYQRFEVNRNFGPACNHGAQLASSPLLLFLNNDTLVTTNWLPPLQKALQADARLGAVGPLLTYPDGRVQHLGVVLSPTGGVAHLYHLFPAAHKVVQKNRRLQALTGAALLLPKSLFEQVGGFYEGYRNGFEDLDLCYQLRRLDYELTCIPQSRVVHLTSQSQGRFEADKENAVLFSARCGEKFKPDEHFFAHADGFTLHFTQEFTAELVYDAEPGTDIARIWEQVQAEPFWKKGYAALQDFFWERKMWNEILDVLLYKIQFFYSRQIVLDILRVGTRLNRKEVIDSFRTDLEHFDQKSGIASYKECLAVREYAVCAQDALLVAACECWLKSHGDTFLI